MTEKFTPEFIAAARELAAKATPRPWKFYDAYNVVSRPGDVNMNRIGNDDYDDVVTSSRYGHNEIEMHEVDAEYLGTACNNYEAALSEIERLQGLVNDLRENLSAAEDATMIVDTNGKSCPICDGEDLDHDGVWHKPGCPFCGL